MSSKMNYIPHISSYEDIRAEMSNDLQYRLASRTAKTSLGRPLYYRIYGWFVTPCDIKRIDDDDEFDADTTEFDKLFESFSREAIS